MDTAVQAFRKCVLDAYRPLIESGSYSVISEPRGHFANLFFVRIGNTSTLIEVEGINWGANAWTKVFRADKAAHDRDCLPIGRLLEQRGAVPVFKKGKRQDSLSQEEQIYLYAYAIMNAAKDVLTGDFSALDVLVAEDEELQQQRDSRAPSPSQKAANIASSEAGHAFKNGDYSKTVELLKPHLKHLNDSQKKRYQLALSRLAGGT